MIGGSRNSYIATLVERHTRYVMLVKVANKDTQSVVSALIVRRHINWNNQVPDLKEDLVHLVVYIRRRICGIASAGFPWFAV